eukprot:SAG31_NODE_3283_length_4466_cov_1.746279_4_plen_97_part_00
MYDRVRNLSAALTEWSMAKFPDKKCKRFVVCTGGGPVFNLAKVCCRPPSASSQNTRHLSAMCLIRGSWKQLIEERLRLHQIGEFCHLQLKHMPLKC